MAQGIKASVPDNIQEEYYQISEEILSSFSKYRPPVDLFRFRDDIGQLYPLFRKGQRLSNEQVEEVLALCRNGDLFVSRSDHPIYVEHIAKQADLVLVDANLKDSEAADILIKALGLRLAAFLEQPVLPLFESLYKDVMVLTEYVTLDKHRCRLFMRRLHMGQADLVNHCLNNLQVGMWLYIQTNTAEFKRRAFDRTCLGLLLMDVGMSKIPGFIVSKQGSLKPDEMEKIYSHPLLGIKMLQKLNLSFDELNQAVMQHHERLDGSGYPQKLKAEAISPSGRLAAVADSFSAMLTERTYAKAINPRDAAQTLVTEKNKYDSKYSMQLLNAFLTGEFKGAN